MKADLLIVNASVWTGWPAQPRARAIGLRGDQIVFVGSSDEASGLQATRTIDAAGRSVLPGFIDNHQHLFFASAELDNLAAEHLLEYPALEQAILAHAHATPEREWVCVSHVQYSALPQDGLTRQHLDRLVPARPLLLMDYSYHTAWANTRALELAGLLHGAHGGPGSKIVQDEHGTATGELREPSAFAAVLALTGGWGRATHAYTHGQETVGGSGEQSADRQMIVRGLERNASLGITSVQNMDGDAYQLGLYRQLEQEGRLSARVSVPLMVRPDTSVAALRDMAALSHSFQGDWVRSGRLKFFMDGVIENGQAFMLEPYAALPGRGAPLFSAEAFEELACEGDRLGLQLGIHAIGDAALRRTLDGLEAARRLNGARDSRHRIEHLETVHPDDLQRLAALGVTASMQPGHVPGTGLVPLSPWLEAVGPARWATAFPWRDLKRTGARLTFGSDWPIISQNPLLGLRAALTRTPWQPGDPDQRLTLDEALHAYTSESAAAEFMEHRKGSLRPGHLADVVMLSAGLDTTAPERLADVAVDLTVAGGRVVYER